MIYAALFLCASLSPEASLQAAVARAQAIHPVSPAQLDRALVDLAQFLQTSGRYREAEPLYLQSSVLNQATFGAKSLAAGRSLLRLGAIYHAELRLNQAETVTRQAADLLESLAGPDHFDYAIALANLAAILASQGENARAEPVLRRALFILARLTGPDSPTVAALQVNLGLIHLRQGEYRQAASLLQSSLALYESTQDPSRATALAALAELAIAEKRWQDADAFVSQAYEFTVRFNSGAHSSLAGLLRMKGSIEFHNGRLPQAITAFEKSIELFERFAGPHSLVLVPVLQDYGNVLRRAHRKSASKSVYKRALEICRTPRE